MASLAPGVRDEDPFDVPLLPIVWLEDYIRMFGKEKFSSFISDELLKNRIVVSVPLELSTVHNLQACKTCGEALRQIMAPAEETVHRPIKDMGVGAAREAWKIPYVVPEAALELVASMVQEYAKQWDPLYRFVPLAAMLQSSGWGKSRLICELWRKDFYVIYLSCMRETQSGFPRRTGKLADILDDPKSTEVDFGLLITSVLAVLKENVAAGMSAEDWIKEWIKEEVEADGMNKFQTQVHERYLKMQQQVPDTLPQKTAYKQLVHYHEVYFRGLYVQELALDAKVLLCVDEAGDMHNFVKYRRALRSIPRNSGFFSLVLGTDRKVSELASAFEDDPSARVRSGTPYKLYHPIYLIGKSDLFVKDSGGIGSSVGTDIDSVLRYGRPLWAAYYDSVKLPVDQKAAATVRLAWKKLLGRDVDIDGPKSNWVTQEVAVAVFACIVGLDVIAWGTLPQELVARHMRTIVKISEDRKRVYTAVAAEPALAAGAAVLLHAKDDDLLGNFLDKLTEVFVDGLVLEGVRGETVARIVIMLAMHECTKGHNYIHPVPLETFLEVMFGRKVVQDLRKNCVNISGTVFFNSFAPTSAPPSPELLDQCYERCTALVARRNERVLDFALPARDGLPVQRVTRAVAKRMKLLHHRISFPGQVKCRKGEPSMKEPVENIQEDNRLDAQLELLFQIGSSKGKTEVCDHTIVVHGLDGFKHLKKRGMGGVLKRLKRLSKTHEDVFRTATDEEKLVLQGLIPLGYVYNAFVDKDVEEHEVSNAVDVEEHMEVEDE